MTGAGFPHGPGIIAGTELFPPIRLRGDPGGDAASMSPKHPRGILSYDTMSPYLHSSRRPRIPTPELPGESGRLS
jgi:hypothetical protein